MALPPTGYRKPAPPVVSPVAPRPPLPEDRGDKARMPYPLGAWVGDKFIFKSPEAEKQWQGDSFEQGSHHLLWMKGRRLRPDESTLARMGLPRSDDTYLGPDGQRYQTTLESREDPRLARLRAAHLAAESAQGSATDMGQRASLKALPQAMAMMAQGARVEAQPLAANDNQAAANDNAASQASVSSGMPAASSVSLPSQTTRVESAEPIKQAASPGPAEPKIRTTAELAAYNRSGHMTAAQRRAASDDVTLLYSGATAGYGGNAIAALKALGDYADGKEFGASYNANLSAEQQRTEEARNREGIAGALIESLPSFIPGYGDVTGLIADLKMFREHPEERTWKNIAMTAAGLLPFIPSTAGAIRRVDKAVEAAEDGAKAVAKEGGIIEDSAKVIRESESEATFSKDVLGQETGVPEAHFSRNYPKTFFTAHPELEGKVTVHRAIEGQVLQKYPGLFSEAEIFALDNLRGIPNELNSTLHLSNIRMEWNVFYNKFPNATKEDILRKVAEIDEMFGHQFLPGRSVRP